MARSRSVVAIVDFGFEPGTLTMSPGTAVVWTNEGQAPHTVTGDWADSGTLETGDGFRFTFAEQGTYPYDCLFHPEMVGEVIVDPDAPPPSGQADGAGGGGLGWMVFVVRVQTLLILVL